ncbi:hypothetical protein GCM10025787_22440 [Saccharopolyspora rosea]|uniref:Peptidoglycan recognition protein n=1 Tax=Saccharopolyspora rosea TaxID=524884 RepID=A0ABW3FZE6_9PSEU
MRSLLCVPIAMLLATSTAHAVPDTRAGTEHVALRDVAEQRDATRAVHTARPFSVLGLTWDGAAPDDVEVRVRTGERWSAWTHLDPADSGRGTEPLWTGRTDTAEVRARRGAADVTDELRLVAIAPDPSPAPAPREGRGGGPAVVTRAEWGADEHLMTWPPQRTTTKAITVHHTAGTNDYACAQSAELVRGIFQYHAVELKWGDIGYHALVDKCGTVFEGRAGQPWDAADAGRGDVIGGHVAGFNRNTFGVAMMGNFDQVAPTPETVRAVARIAGWKLGQVGVPPDGRTTLTAEGAPRSKFPAGARVPLPTIFGHRDVSNTACPGQHGYEQLDAIRAAARQPAP